MPEPLVVTSVKNPRIRATLALREPRERREQGRILIDGAREIHRAVASGVRVVEAFVSIEQVEALGGEARAALTALESTDAQLVEVTPRVLARLAYGDRDEGLVAVAEAPDVTLEHLQPPDAPLLGVIEGVEKPGNLGAILRSADGAGLDGLIVADPGTDPFNPNVIRASLGTVFSVPLAVASTGEVLAWLREREIRIVAARVDASIDYTDVDLAGAVAIALGSEARGLSDAWGELAAASVRVPMLGIADSLNVSATAAVLFYEALRQRATTTHQGLLGLRLEDGA